MAYKLVLAVSSTQEADPDNIDERANAVRRKFSKFADNFGILKQTNKKIFLSLYSEIKKAN